MSGTIPGMIGTPAQADLPFLPGTSPQKRLSALAGEFARLSSVTRDFSSFVPAALDALSEVTHSVWLAVYELPANASQNTVPSFVPGTGNTDEPEKDTVVSLLQAAKEHQRPVARPLAGMSHRFAVVVPLRLAGKNNVFLLAIVPANASDIASQGSLIEYTASVISQASFVHQLERLQWESNTSAAILELLNHTQTCDDLTSACQIVVNELAAYLSCDQVVLGICQPKRAGVEVRAISGMTTIDRHATGVVKFAEALNETVIRNCLTSWPPTNDGDRHALLAHRKLCSEQHIEGTISIPLTDPNRVVVGAILCTGKSTALQDARVDRVLEALAPLLATALEHRQKLDPSRWSRVHAIWKSATTQQKLWLRSLAVALVVIPLVPISHRVKTKCEVVPSTRRFCVAPFAGILKSTQVRVGDIVEANAPLSLMDDRELRWELEGLLAERARAAKLRDTAHADHETSEAQLAELEMERLDVRIQLLRQRESQLQIVSPIAGVVLQGELDDAEGAPVDTGQALFEIAPLEMLRLELAIPDDDVAWVQEGMRVKARLEGGGNQTILGSVERIRPAAELVDNENVFVAEVVLPNKEGKLRPGMHGTSRILSHRRSLGWIWLHKAWFHIRLWIG
jgi:Barrel-sandwich domain of CusB or HlyD membrane-fusion